MENKQKLTEIARSFGQKLFLEPYKPIDFFCSQKMEVPIEVAEETSRQLFQFCKHQVEYDIAQYIKEKEREQFIEIDEAYKNQPEITSKFKNKKEQVEFDKKEWLAHNAQDAKSGD